jgi:hypothetical protein
MDHAVWVTAFAGTTKKYSALLLLGRRLLLRLLLRVEQLFQFVDFF